MKICFLLEAFTGPFDATRSRKALLHLLEALAQINTRFLAERAGRVPTLYGSTVVYRREPKKEDWKDIAHILADGHGDCEDLAAWRVAELRSIGINAQPYIKWRGQKHHALVLLPSGQVEDPSLALGMNDHEITRRPVIVPR